MTVLDWGIVAFTLALAMWGYRQGLIVGTLIGVATLNMAGSLYFFLPRSDPEKKRLYIHHAWVYLAGIGVLCGLAVSPLNPLLPEAARELTKYGALVPTFVAVWFAALLLEYLPTIDERIGWQAGATITVSLVRVVLLADDREGTADSVERLMGTKAEARFAFISDKAEFASEDMLDV